VVKAAPSPPKVSLSRAQWIRLVAVGILVLIAVARAAPDVVRVVYPLNIFGYVTDGNGVVVRAGTGKLPKGGESIRVGDRVLTGEIKPFDRKPGLAGPGFTYDNPDRHLPIARNGHERVLHLIARPESRPTQTLALLRIALFLASVGLGAILFLVKPSIATAAFFLFCLGGDAPTSYADLIVPNPWREVAIWIGDTLRGAARPALLLFAFCLVDAERPARHRLFALPIALIALALGTLHAYGDWLLTFAGRPAQGIDQLYTNLSSAVTAVTVIVFGAAFVRTRGPFRQNVGWIVVAFACSAIAGLLSDELFPTYIPLWFNSFLVSTPIIPIVVVWISVVRHRFFNVDFVVSRAVVYVALTATVVGTISVTEELATYTFYNNTDFAYGILIAMSMALGAFTGKIKTFIDHLVDRFIFRDRHAQRIALEFIAGYILDAESEADVYRALLADAAHALQLSFGGILARRPDGSYELTARHEWPKDFEVRLGPEDELPRAIARSRGALTFSGKDSRLIQRAYPNGRLAFAAPIFFDRSVSGIVVYGHNVSGLDLDPDEREHLIRVVAHASIALNAIELARYREQAGRERDPAHTGLGNDARA
jgi:hypothetical protein